MTDAAPLSLFLSAFDIATMIAVVGLLACRLAVLRGVADGALERRMHAATGGALALLTLASLGILISRTLEMNGGNWSTLPADTRLALTMTHFGHVWAWRVPALVIAWAAWARRRHPTDRAWTTWIMALAAAAVVMTRSDTGHMADHGDLAWAVWIDWLHVLAAGAWIGSVFGISLVVFPHLLRSGQRSLRDAAAIFQRLSTLSGAALALVIACGIYSTTQLLGPLGNLLTTPFGINLGIKLGLVLILILIGAHNRWVKLPRLLAGAGIATPVPVVARWLRARGHGTAHDPVRVLQSCARALWIESLLGLVVIGATGLLIHQMPPADMHGTPMMPMASDLTPSAGEGPAKPDLPPVHSGHVHAEGRAMQPTPTAMNAEEIARTPVATALHVSACWVRLLPAPAPSAAYFELTNSGRHDAVLQAAASPAYGNVMLHLTEETGGVSRMHPASEIALPAGGKVTFAPGGYHVMLMQPSRPLAVGDAMPLALLFAGPEHVAASCKVRPADAMGAH